MSMTVDTLIQNLESKANSFSNSAFDFSVRGLNTAYGAPITIPDQVIAYVTPGNNPLTIALPPEWNNADTLALVKELMDTLNAFFAKYFPNISTEYTDWINLLEQHIAAGVPIHEDNAEANLMRQELDAVEGARNKHTIRSGYSNRGFQLPPGVLVRDTLNDIDTRSAKLVTQSIGTASSATDGVVGAYKTLLSTAIATDSARVYALKAMSDLMRTAVDMYGANNDKKVALLRAQSEAVQATIAYYKAELALDDANTKIYDQNTKLRLQRFAVDGEFFGKNEGLQVQSALAASAQAARIAQAAYSALNTIVSSSTVGFS